MKQQSTYHLNEQRLSKELRGRRVAADEAAYRRFCAYSEAHSEPAGRAGFTRVRATFDRKYMVPAAAAVVLIALSLLLVNFAGPGKNKTSAAVIEEPFVPMPQTEPEVIAMPPSQSHDLPSQPVASASDPLPASKPEVITETKVVESDARPTDKKTPPANPATPGIKPQGDSAQSPTMQAGVKKPRRNEAELLEPVQLPDIRPALLTPEQEEEIRIN